MGPRISLYVSEFNRIKSEEFVAGLVIGACVMAASTVGFALLFAVFK